jgi:hypothetical protein
MSALYARFLTFAGVTGALVLGVSTVSGADAPKDGAALELVKKAIYTDYLGTKFADAEKKLKQAIKLCTPAPACSAKVRAQVFTNLGVVYIGGMNKADEGKAQFVEALKQDPSITPDADLVSPEIEAAFAEAKKSGGGAPSPGPATPTSPAAPAAPAAAATGDLVHTAPAEDATLTPLPLYAELPAAQTAARMQLSYKPFGAIEWKSMAMKPVGKGYAVEIPCAEIGTAEGALVYFIQAFDSDSNLVSWSGTRAAPNRVAIKTALAGEQPHLPGQPAPARCADTGDCPPGFPGCKGNRGDEPPPCEPGTECTTPPPESTAKKNWLSIAVQMDFLVMPASTQTCAGSTQSNGYTCFAGSQYYAGLPFIGTDPAKDGDAVTGGMVPATLRILAGYDRVLGSNFTLGARVGVAFLGGPAAGGGKAFLPVHAEARAAYWFGHEPFERTGVRPYIVIDGGVAEVDGKVSAKVYNGCPTVTMSCTTTTPAGGYSYDFDHNIITSYDAWQKAGTGFVGGGLGILFAPTPRVGPFIELKYMELLGAFAPALNVELGFAFGL